MKDKINYSIEQLSNENAFQTLYRYAVGHPKDIAISYSADVSVKRKEKKCLENKITYKQLINNILNSYKNLVDNGVQAGDTVIFSSIATPELIYTCYACIMMGAMFKSIDVRFSSEEILNSFRQSPAKMFFCMERFCDKILLIYGDLNVNKIVTVDATESLPKLVQLGSKLAGAKKLKDGNLYSHSTFVTWKQYNNNYQNLEIPKEQSKPTDVINLSATTGSTGVPKPVMHDNNNWNSQVYQANKALPLYMKDKVYYCSVPWVSFGLPVGIHVFLCHGITIDIDPLWTQELNPYYIIKKDPQWWIGAPGWIDPLFTDEKFINEKLKNTIFFVCGGAPLFKEKHLLYQKILDEMTQGNPIKANICPGYGLTETTAPISFNDGNYPPGTNGKIWDLIEAKVVDPNSGVELPDGEIGHLMIKSNQSVFSPIFRGYQNMPDKTKEIYTSDGWLKTGDLCKIIKRVEGRPVLSEITRLKNILTYNGYNIDCDKICDCIINSGLVKEGDVIGTITVDGNQSPLICVVPNFQTDHDKLKNELFKILEEKCPSYYIYAGIEILEELTKKSMKIDKQKLKEMFLDEKGLYVQS